jgi:CelD/BcsL family acetyltransferase involved in cellulose biosynthesis
MSSAFSPREIWPASATRQAEGAGEEPRPLRSATRTATNTTVVHAYGHPWSRELANHRDASLFSSRAWIEAITRTYGFDVLASISARGGVADAAIFFSHIHDLRGSRIVCLPFSDYCDPLVEDVSEWNELVEPLLAFEAPIRLRCLRNVVPQEDTRFRLCKRAKWHSIDLDHTEGDLWARLAGQARQNIRHACLSGVIVREGNSLGDVQLFHAMHAHLRKAKYRLLAQPLAFFENLHAIFSQEDRVHVLIAELDGTPLAGLFLLQWNGVLYYKFNATLDQRCRPNDLLLWRAMLFGHQRGLAALDLGLSEIGQPGLVRYKRKFATQERDISFFEWLPDGYRDPQGDEASEVFGQVTRLLTDPSVSDEITQEAGEKFYRFFA